ncbi:MAG: orotidine-5'-phosphate decarboxylase [Phycisphaeraceae bacterium]|nr:MAG: orotidine-5'-phosphate decarboxylase [Phycisphaeraceae bacterium]
MTESPHFGDLLCSAIDRVGAPACVGIDPVHERLPVSVRNGPGVEPDHVRAFCLGVLETIAGIVPVVKPQSACFERFGAAGVAVLADVIARARDLGFIVILDVKRGDIGSTAAHYAAAAASTGAHAVTVNAYMGESAVRPFLEAGLGVYILVRTSNPDSDEIQAPRLQSGETVAQHLAGFVSRLGAEMVGFTGLSSVGAVVGATKSAADGKALRKCMPAAPVLVPGVGVQGGTVEQVRPLVRPGATSPGRLGMLVNAGRSVLYEPPGPGEAWEDAVARAARQFAADCAGLAAQ